MYEVDNGVLDTGGIPVSLCLYQPFCLYYYGDEQEVDTSCS